ncbi:sugar-binding protein [Stieleria marina]|uniref:D-ribose-binding periplasmic protein n=1 Tax=Stieleria marina TaxID=1930275 RepID=A0A517NQG5_9BACT|nr:D-ribose-binding periplasmic protein precursor [Planctomycetes bacterium K23_9]
MVSFRVRGRVYRRLVCLMFACFVLTLNGCGSDSSSSTTSTADEGDRAKIAFVTNQIASFWNIAKVGAEDAGKDFDVDVDVRMPADATAVEQKRIVEDLISGGIDALAISPIDADNQIELLNNWAEKIPLVTHDSDAPESNRLMYIGMDNYTAGRMCGELIKKALPEGGEIMLTIGRLAQDNSKRRRQGVIDVLVGRDSMPESCDPTGDVIKAGKYTILDTLLDQGVSTVAKQKAEDAITTYPKIAAMVGLFAYNPPALLQAIKSQNRPDIKIIGFDEDEITLQGIKDGTVTGTVVQDPYSYGYKSVEVLKAILDGDNSVIPEGKFVDIPARAITKENVDEFWDDLKSKMGS